MAFSDNGNTEVEFKYDQNWLQALISSFCFPTAAGPLWPEDDQESEKAGFQDRMAADLLPSCKNKNTPIENFLSWKYEIKQHSDST